MTLREQLDAANREIDRLSRVLDDLQQQRATAVEALVQQRDAAEAQGDAIAEAISAAIEDAGGVV